jgi:hypothetical protein
MSDEELKARIHDANLAMQAAKSKSLQRYWAHRVAELVGQRSPERVAAMEAERGLRAP